ncbi:MAG: BrnT family toxin [Kiritimatiellae bacterium]|nr:BrnT family toxin [Kiritimatiellia bacterium]
MQLEYDNSTSESNKLKHGLDFVEAQVLWEDRERLLVPARTQDEPRFLPIGKIKSTHWSAIFTLRGEVVKIISVRQSRKNEVNHYEE